MTYQSPSVPLLRPLWFQIEQWLWGHRREGTEEPSQHGGIDGAADFHEESGGGDHLSAGEAPSAVQKSTCLLGWLRELFTRGNSSQLEHLHVARTHASCVWRVQECLQREEEPVWRRPQGLYHGFMWMIFLNVVSLTVPQRAFHWGIGELCQAGGRIPVIWWHGWDHALPEESSVAGCQAAGCARKGD